MKIQISILVLLFSLTGKISAQSEIKKDVKDLIDYFFKGLQNGDTSIVKSTFIDNPKLQTTTLDNKGKTILKTVDYNSFLKSLAAKKPEDKWEEKLLSYNIQIDGNMANVWTPYKFYFNNKFSHCGVNTFQLVSFEGEWKIIYLIDTRRKNNCTE